MLVLTRKTNESILINDNIEIVIKHVGGNRTRIGVSAPEGVKIFRKELVNKAKSSHEAQCEQ